MVEAMEAEETVAEKAAVETKAAARVEEARVVYARGFARILKFYYARASWIGPISISSTPCLPNSWRVPNSWCCSPSAPLRLLGVLWHE